MNIINTKIVNSVSDVFWDGLPQRFTSMKPAPVLVLASTDDAEPRVQRMLDACKLGQDEYNLLFLTPDENVAWHKLREVFQPSVAFLIGIMPAQLGISALFRLHEVNRYDGVALLPTLSIGYLDQHESEKKHLWANAMKPLLLDRSFAAYFS